MSDDGPNKVAMASLQSVWDLREEVRTLREATYKIATLLEAMLDNPMQNISPKVAQEIREGMKP